MAKAFEFRLETLLGVRRVRQDEASRARAAAQEAVESTKRRIAALLSEEAEARGARPGDGAALRMQADCLLALERRLSRERAALQDGVKAELERRRELIEARKGVRVLERFREKERAEHRKAEEQAERRFLDEIGRNPALGA